MKVVETSAEFLSLRKNLRSKTVGFVPTMGALHEGHLSLIKKAKAENNICVVSIFVNPNQFNDSKDYQSYPRLIENDIEKLEQEGVDILFSPIESEMYREKAEITLDIPTMTHHLCGASRTGHFNGVLLVVSKLFNIISPDKAYFGKKDYQQLSVIRKMTTDLSFDVEITGCDIVRETSGLAMSSRNMLLSDEERDIAANIYASLKQTVEIYNKGEKKVSTLLDYCRKTLLKAGIKSVDYIEVCDKITLQKIQTANERSIILVAVFLGNVRLIDNLEF